MSNTRQNLHSKVSPLDKRVEAWQAAITAAETHVKLGSGLQARGLDTLKISQGADPESAAKLIQQATTAIANGVKIEREARDKLIELYNEEPK